MHHVQRRDLPTEFFTLTVLGGINVFLGTAKELNTTDRLPYFLMKFNDRGDRMLEKYRITYAEADALFDQCNVEDVKFNFSRQNLIKYMKQVRGEHTAHHARAKPIDRNKAETAAEAASACRALTVFRRDFPYGPILK